MEQESFKEYDFQTSPIEPARDLLIAELGTVGFESFMETISRRKQKVDIGSDQEEQEAVFDGDQKDVKEEEKRGVDSFSLEKVVSSYKEKFGKSQAELKLYQRMDAMYEGGLQRGVVS